MQEKGTISIHSENIFPIIKKFLYSDNEIFLRELVSNAVDASQKIKHLASMGQYNGDLGDLKVQVSFDKEAKTITVSDNGIGMTADEIKKYINQIAFSGATEFVEKFQNEGVEKDQIIGHFGLGFYSAFMVAGEVEIRTKSYQEGTEAARWICDGSTEFEITPDERAERGTDIILHVSEEGEEFLDNFRLKDILTKYCRFLPIAIEFEGEQINNVAPLWTKSPSEITDEEYISFYKEMYPMAEDPLFWIHLNVDYPFNLTGILYFPKLKNDFDFQRNKIHLYSRQVFITEEVKDVVPEFLMLLNGVIDSPDIPLNVSRSFLQADANVRKINAHISKKVADKLKDLYKNDRKAYEEKWDDVSLFMKYGMVSEEKFNEKVQDICLFKDTDGGYYTLEEYKTAVSANQTDKDEQVIAPYASDVAAQHTFIQSAKKKEYKVLVLDSSIDPHFIGHVEQKFEKFKLKRVDSESVEKLIDKGETKEMVLSDGEQEKVKEVFEKVLNNPMHQVSVESLSPDEFPVSVTRPEFMRRMEEMSAVSGMNMGAMPQALQVVVNGNHPLISKILKAKAKKESLTKQAVDLALLSQGMLTGADLTSFVERSVAIAAE